MQRKGWIFWGTAIVIATGIAIAVQRYAEPAHQAPTNILIPAANPVYMETTPSLSLPEGGVAHSAIAAMRLPEGGVRYAHSDSVAIRGLLESAGKTCLLAFWASISIESVSVTSFSCRLLKRKGEWGMVGQFGNREIPGTFQRLEAKLDKFLGGSQ